jgi:hypothetical protein
MKSLLTIIAILVLATSCDKIKYRIGSFPEEATNLNKINSPYDDINSNIPTIDENLVLMYSSNSFSKGQYFNIVGGIVIFTWFQDSGILSQGAIDGVSNELSNLKSWIRKTETTFNEKGPYSFMDAENNKMLLFSRDNDQGIYSIYAEPEKSSGAPNARIAQTFQIFDEPVSEMYPSFYGKDFLKGADIASQGKPEKFLISSDRNGVFDIYELDLPANSSALAYLFGDTPKSPNKISINSTANDHMPFVYGDMLVFASDRAGGFGGYDLYYSMKTGSGWSEPVNFGPNINSPQDEYRPVVSDHPNFSNRAMIFSSNRPGGLGGFDLYFVGIPKF